MGDTGGVGISGTILVNKGGVEFHVGSGGARSRVFVRDGNVVVVAVLRDGCRHAVVVHRGVHATAAGEQGVVGIVVGRCTGLPLVGAVTKVGIGCATGGPCPVVGCNVASPGGVGIAVGLRHVRHVHVFIGEIPLEQVMGIGATAGLGTVSAIVGGDVLGKHHVTGAGGRGCTLKQGLLIETFRWRLVQFCHHAGHQTSEKDGDDGKGEHTHGGFHASSTLWRVYETLASATRWPSSVRPRSEI